jgi:hypothetical protein
LLPPFEEDIKKMAKDWLLENGWSGHAEHSLVKSWMAEFYNKAKKTYKYTEEDLKKAIDFGYSNTSGDGNEIAEKEKKFIQSLNQHKFPIAFECEMHYLNIDEIREKGEGFLNSKSFIKKTITNSEGRTEWVGKYIFN